MGELVRQIRLFVALLFDLALFVAVQYAVLWIGRESGAPLPYIIGASVCVSVIALMYVSDHG